MKAYDLVATTVVRAQCTRAILRLVSSLAVFAKSACCTTDDSGLFNSQFSVAG